MPAREVMAKFKAGTLHSGKNGPVVKSKKQADAILLSYVRKEGHSIPMKKTSPMAGHLNTLKAKGILKSTKKKKY